VKSGPPGRWGLDAVETEAGEIERIHERIDNANRIFLVDPIFEALRQKRRLSSIGPRRIIKGSITTPVFSHPGSKVRLPCGSTARLKFL
jgi:hypothetical protein